MVSPEIQFSARVVQVVSSGLAPYKLPRALDSLLIYQQPSSTTLYYSYLGMPVLIEARLRNETREITGVNTLARVAQQRTSQPGGNKGNDNRVKNEGTSPTS